MSVSDFPVKTSKPLGPVNPNAFVACRLPGETGKILMTGRVYQLSGNSTLSSGKEGFIMAPFADGSPVLWLEAEKISSLDDEKLSEPAFPIVIPDIQPGQKISMTSEEEYYEQVIRITDLLKAGIAGKVVLSRQIIIPFNNKISLMGLFDRLCRSNAGAFVYLAFFPGIGLWIGATPETLLKYQDNTITTMALAGTRPLGENGTWNEKDKEEHAFVVDYIHEKLKAAGCPEIIKSQPYSINAGLASHLRTDFSAGCDRRKVAEIVDALHPTPAVCGWPADKALEIINSTEKHSRACYTGYLGPVTRKTVHLFVNLRCVQLAGEKAIVYAGGGLTALSDPKSEWDETVLKSTTMLSAIEKMQNLAD
ncbi:MAG: chorismate-binding protein [Lentimicrobium sp.]